MVMMILWRKQTRIVVYLKYTSNYGLNTRIAPDKQFSLAMTGVFTTNGTRHGLAGASNSGIVEFV